MRHFARWNSAILALVAALIFAVAAAPAAMAQDTVTANVPFAFRAAGRSFPAGTYDFQINWAGERVTVSHAGNAKAQTATVPILCSLAMHEGQQAMVVFDRTGNDLILSEVWLPDSDGALTYSEKTKHTHHVVKAQRK
jgi:hypothetical protein